jgi:hypothetical protein
LGSLKSGHVIEINTFILIVQPTPFVAQFGFVRILTGNTGRKDLYN